MCGGALGARRASRNVARCAEAIALPPPARFRIPCGGRLAGVGAPSAAVLANAYAVRNDGEEQMAATKVALSSYYAKYVTRR